MGRQDEKFTKCCLTFLLSPNLYYHIDTQGLFNLKDEIRGPFTGRDFLPEPNIQLEVTLHPDLLPRLFANATNAEEAASHLLNLSQQQLKDLLPCPKTEPAETPRVPEQEVDTSQSQIPLSEPTIEVPNQIESHQPRATEATIDPLLHTESWLCLSVKQQQGDTETGYSTFWSHINPSILQKVATSGEQISAGIADFFAEWVEANFSKALQEASDEHVEEITRVFQNLTDDVTATDWDSSGGEIFETVVSFFKTNKWPIAQVEGKTSLQLAFQGENGQWTCYAITHEERQEFVFYSLCPVNVPDKQRLAMAEFLTRVNYGITIGNFEMDLDSGEIHYKTSIDVEGDRLSTTLVRQVVYTNIAIVDRYLPGIMAVIYGDVSPNEALTKVENEFEL
ncbi:MAG: YbjN domain-containing protein [Synechococcus sp.]